VIIKTKINLSYKILLVLCHL